MNKVDENANPARFTGIDPARLLGARLLFLLYLVRSSSDSSLGDQHDLNDVELRVVSILGSFGPKTCQELAILTGRAKHQISRATTSLAHRGWIARPSHRGQFRLLEVARDFYTILRAAAQERERRLTAGISDAEIRSLKFAVSVLIQITENMFHEEQRLAAKHGKKEETVGTMVSAAVDLAGQDMLVPSLVTLSVVIQRFSLLRWRRLVGLYSFEWVVLSRVAKAGTMEQGRLILLTFRDKGQISRTVDALVKSGLLLRSRESGKREILLTATAEGQRIYQVTAEDYHDIDARFAARLGTELKSMMEKNIEIMIGNSRSAGSIDEAAA